MADRAHHSRSKHSPHSKKKKSRQSHQGSIVSQRQSVGLTNEATVPAKVVIPLSNALTPVPTAVKCPNLLIELRRVGILAGIVLAILLVLALVL